ncbi:FMN-binding negative transcriptional regulator [Tessaracoccus sp. Z1128]
METTQPTSSVYVPASQRVDDVERCRALLAEVGAALWITGGDGSPSATLLPTTWDADRLVAHASAHNAQFDLPLGSRVPCRVVIQGAHAYVSPRWYPSIQPVEHGGAARGRAEGRAVGTWDYEQVQIAGWLTTHRDPDRLRDEVMRQAEALDAARLSDTPHSPDAHRGPWSDDEAPADYMAAMLQSIIGVELEITEVVGRFKLSRNRTDADRAGVVDGLRERGRDRDLRVADAVASVDPLPPG